METPEIKKINIIKDEKNGMFYAKFANGGQLPAVLSGMWTHEAELQARISHYLSSRKPVTKAQKAVAKPTRAKTINKGVSK